jgi:hypothetical protein
LFAEHFFDVLGRQDLLFAGLAFDQGDEVPAKKTEPISSM